MENIELTNEMIAVFAILGLTVFLFAFEIFRVDVAAIFILVILGLSAQVPGYEGLIDQNELFDGFASNAVISIIAVMIIGAGLDKTGVMSKVAAKILRYAGRTEQKIIPTVSVAVAGVSSFMQNVAAAALFLPVVTRISRRTQIPLSRLLMPMGFGAILGGTVTMVGSSPLILLNDLILTSNRTLPADVAPMEAFHLFAVTPVGVVLVAVGVAYFAVSGRFMLPRTKEKVAGADNLQHFHDLYGIAGQIYELRVTPDSDLVDVQLRDVEERGRAGWILAVRTGKEVHLVPGRDTWIRSGSELAIMGSRKEVELYADRHGLVLKPEIESFSEYLSVTSAGIAEVVIPPDSELVNKTLGEVQFRRKYGAKILAIYRVKEVLDTDMPNIRFQAGDTLILHSRWEDLTLLANDSNFAVVTDFPRETYRPGKLRVAALCFGFSIMLIILTDVRLSVALMSGAVGMIVFGVLRIEEAYRAISWQSVFLLASLIPLGIAVEESGAAAWMANETLAMLQGMPVWVLQLCLAILATGFTLVVSNVGATVLLVPLAVNIAVRAGGDPAVFALTVGLATSNSFLIPTHQVNALILGPGGYRVADFLRAGSAMTVLYLIVIIAMLALFY
ncbi:MAG: hypothetical protein MAG794_01652 [Gammaproteobacteria bacterium]|nr:hypothetical protein [Gammaproteobacteria bacterium]